MLTAPCSSSLGVLEFDQLAGLEGDSVQSSILCVGLHIFNQLDLQIEALRGNDSQVASAASIGALNPGRGSSQDVLAAADRAPGKLKEMLEAVLKEHSLWIL